MHEAHPPEVKVEVVLHLIYQGLWFGIMLNDKTGIIQMNILIVKVQMTST